MKVKSTLGVVSAFGCAKKGGYRGTDPQEFYDLLANLPEYAERAELASNQVADGALQIEENVALVTASAEATALAKEAAVASKNDAETASASAIAAQEAAETAQEAAEEAAASITTDTTLAVEGKAADSKATGDAISAIKNDLTDFLDANTTPDSYNLLDPDAITVYDNRSLDTDLYRYNSSPVVKSFAFPVEEGKTYTFSRKNSCARLIIGCGEDLYTDTENHTLLNTVNCNSHPVYGTITVPTGGKYLYVFFCNLNYDSSVDYTLEEAMITEGSEVLPYVQYSTKLNVKRENLSADIRTAIDQIGDGVAAYDDILGIQQIISDAEEYYNLLDLSSVTILDSYYVNQADTGTLTHSAATGSVKTIAFPVIAGKTYTFTRKNATSRLIAGCGSQLWNDGSNHDLINVVDARSVGNHFTITAPTGGTYLYIFFYRAASDSDYAATLEEAMIVEGTDILPYQPYVDPTIDPADAASDIAEALNQGKSAYSAVCVSDRWSSRKKIYGIQFNVENSSPLCARIADAADLEQTDFDNIFPWCDMRRCAVSITNGQKTIIYDGESGFALDGSAGNVMVEIPAFYVMRERVNGVERWLISGTQYGGFELHPWFINADGSTAEYRYYGVYIACDGSSDGIFSATGKQAYNNHQKTLTQFSASAKAYGFNRNTVFAFSAIQYLFTIEYATRNSQSIFNGNTYSPYHNVYSTGTWELIESIENNVVKCPVGYNYSGNSFLFYKVGMQVFIGTAEGLNNGFVRTITAITHDGSYFYITVDGDPITLVNNMRISSYAQISGWSDTVTTPSGIGDQDSHVASFRYRYIENIWGNLWEVLDGLKLKNSVYYITHDFEETDLTKWDALSYVGFMVSKTDHDVDNWIKRMGFDQNNRSILLPDMLFTDSARTITLQTDAGETVATGIYLFGEKYYGDAYYSGTDTAAEYVPVIGGGWDHHENGGLFCLRFIPDGGWLYGERITC